MVFIVIGINGVGPLLVSKKASVLKGFEKKVDDDIFDHLDFGY